MPLSPPTVSPFRFSPTKYVILMRMTSQKYKYRKSIIYGLIEYTKFCSKYTTVQKIITTTIYVPMAFQNIGDFYGHFFNFCFFLSVIAKIIIYPIDNQCKCKL